MTAIGRERMARTGLNNPQRQWYMEHQTSVCMRRTRLDCGKCKSRWCVIM